MDFTDKNVKRITPIILPDGRPGAYVVYTDTDPDTPQGADPGPEKRGTEPPRFTMPKMPWDAPGGEDQKREGQEREKPGGQRRTLPAAHAKNIKRGIAVGMVITALYLLVSTL